MSGRHAGGVDVRLGERLCALRKMRRRTCESLAQIASVCRATLYRYEHGLTPIPASAIIDFAHALDFPVSAFFDGLAEEEQPHAA